MPQKNFTRADRLSPLVQKEVAKIIHYHLENPHFSGVTVTKVKLSNDLSYAKIYVTFLNDTDIETSLKNLNREVKFIRRLLTKQLSYLRAIPNLVFYYDSSIRDGQRLAALIDSAILKDRNQNKDGNDK